jgi:hypothetical protein
MKMGMKAWMLFGVLALVVVSTAYAITEAQAHVGGALQALKLKSLPSKVIGGPQKYEVTQDTIDFLTKAKKDGKTIVVAGNGSITLE